MTGQHAAPVLCTHDAEFRHVSKCRRPGNLSFPSGRHGNAMTPPTAPRTATAPLVESSHMHGDTMVLRCMGRIFCHIVGNVNYFFMYSSWGAHTEEAYPESR